jgi:cysteinyl-tRNA synthetase
MVEGKKMSKSLGNFFVLQDLLEKGFEGREIRQLMISAHYRETFNFTLSGLEGARKAMARIDECISKLRDAADNNTAEPATDVIKKFTAALDDDLNVSSAWAVVFDWVRACNRRLAEGVMDSMTAAAELAAWEHIDTVLGVGRVEEEASAELTALMEERTEARKAKDFSRADAIRDELAEQGWTIEDTPKGPRLKHL